MISSRPLIGPPTNHISKSIFFYLKKNHECTFQTTNKNIARMATRCPENISSVVKYVKLLFPKVLRKESSDSSDSKTSWIFLKLLSTLRKCNLTHLATDVIFSGQRFAILAMFCLEVSWFLCVDRLCDFSHLLTQVAWFIFGEVFFAERLHDFFVEILRDLLYEEVA